MMMIGLPELRVVAGRRFDGFLDVNISFCCFCEQLSG